MKQIILYDSATGNTEYLAKALSLSLIHICALNASYTPGQGNAFRCSNSFFNCVVLFIYSVPLLLMGPS